MGTAMCVLAQRRIGDRWEDVDFQPFQRREKHYDLFGFLADVRNDAGVPPITPPRGVPDDFEYAVEWNESLDGSTYLTVAELLAYDYDRTFQDRRTWAPVRPGSATGQFETTTVRSLLGPEFFEDLERLRHEGIGRIIFGFC